MKTPNTRIAHLKEMIALEEKRTHLLSQITGLDERISALQREFSPPNINATGSVMTRRGQKANGGRGELEKAQAPMSLRSVRAGRAAQIGARAHRVSNGEAALANGGGAVSKLPHSKSIRGKIPMKRGELKARILGALKQAGNSGITIKELSEKLDSKYKNLYIWFVTTGKRIGGIKKVGPARYKLEVA